MTDPVFSQCRAIFEITLYEIFVRRKLSGHLPVAFQTLRDVSAYQVCSPAAQPVVYAGLLVLYQFLVEPDGLRKLLFLEIAARNGLLGQYVVLVQVLHFEKVSQCLVVIFQEKQAHADLQLDVMVVGLKRFRLLEIPECLFVISQFLIADSQVRQVPELVGTQ